MLRTAILALASILIAGCVMTAVGVGVLVDTQIKDGIGIQDFATPLKRTWETVLLVLDEHDIEYPKDFKFDYKKGSKMEFGSGWVSVKPHPKNPKYTRVQARWTSDKTKSMHATQNLFDAIDEKLETGAVAD